MCQGIYLVVRSTTDGHRATMNTSNVENGTKMPHGDKMHNIDIISRRYSAKSQAKSPTGWLLAPVALGIATTTTTSTPHASWREGQKRGSDGDRPTSHPTRPHLTLFWAFSRRPIERNEGFRCMAYVSDFFSFLF